MQLPVIQNVRDVAQRQLCNGCGACAYLAPESIKMVDTFGSGRRPVVDADASAESQQNALRACPGLSIFQDRSATEAGIEKELFEDWGPVLEVWEGHATDPAVRFRGSSGGAITALSIFAVESELFSGVLHTKARKDQPLLNTHVLSTSKAELLEGAGSRYAPASPCEGLGEVENAAGPCVFIGKPCDVAGARAATRQRPALADRLGITIALFCAGTPSLEGSVELLKKMGVANPADVADLRYRGNGWPGDMTATPTPTSTVKPTPISYAKGWGETLQTHRAWRCNVCPDHTGELADISVGDPWYDKPKEGDQGRSLILVRTERGRAFLKAAINAGYLQAERREAKVLPAAQPHLLHARGATFGRLLACKLLGVPVPTFPGMPLFKTWLKQLTLKQKIQSIWGVATRIKRRGLRFAQPVVPLPADWLQTSKQSSRKPETTSASI